MTDTDRGIGRTTRQMKEAPKGATYVWCNEITSYPRTLARELGRTDLRIVPASNARNGCHLLKGLRHVVLDHAAEDLDWRALRWLDRWLETAR